MKGHVGRQMEGGETVARVWMVVSVEGTGEAGK